MSQRSNKVAFKEDYLGVSLRRADFRVIVPLDADVTFRIVGYDLSNG